MGKKIIGLDLDGVILDHTRNKIAVSRKFGYKLSSAETVSDVMAQKIPSDEYRQIQKILYDDPGVSLAADLIEGAKKGLGKLNKSADVRYYLVSRRESRDSAIKILKKYKLWPGYLGPDNVFFVKEKKDKDKIARELGINYFLDDQPSVLKALSSVKNKFLMDPLGVYNKEAQFKNGNYKIVSSWREFLTHLA